MTSQEIGNLLCLLIYKSSMISLQISIILLLKCSIVILLKDFGGTVPRLCDGWQPPIPRRSRRASEPTTLGTLPRAIIVENPHGPGSVSITIPPYQTTSDATYPSRLHTIHILPLLSDEEVQQCRRRAQQHAAETRCWQQPDVQRHATYPTCDFPVDQCAPLQQYLEEEIQFDERIFQSLHTLYDIPMEYMFYLDLFCTHYQAAGTDRSTTTMDRLEPHRDGSLLSFTILLNDPTEFQGGGTSFDALQGSTHPPLLGAGGVVRPRRAGDAVLHSGKLLHGGHVVTAGSRTVLVGFVDVLAADDAEDRILRPGILSNACRDWGRLDVATFRSQRSQRHRPSRRPKYWFRPLGSKWQPTGNGFSNTCPPQLASVRRLAPPEYQRLRRLEIEDQFLRSILLSDEERQQCRIPGAAVVGGGEDYTILSG
jgi:predicted 2-oxoglutarate/Fe(II)-dependent dioxygenase YbiX